MDGTACSRDLVLAAEERRAEFARTADPHFVVDFAVEPLEPQELLERSVSQLVQRSCHDGFEGEVVMVAESGRRPSGAAS